MNCASQLIATIDLTFAMAPALYADDAVPPKANTVGHELAASSDRSDASANSSAFVPPLSSSSWASSSESRAGRPHRAGRNKVFDDLGTHVKVRIAGRAANLIYRKDIILDFEFDASGRLLSFSKKEYLTFV